MLSSSRMCLRRSRQSPLLERVPKRGLGARSHLRVLLDWHAHEAGGAHGFGELAERRCPHAPLKACNTCRDDMERAPLGQLSPHAASAMRRQLTDVDVVVA